MDKHEAKELKSTLYWRCVRDVFEEARAVGLAFINREGTIEDCSIAFAALIRTDRSDVVGKTIFDITPPEGRFNVHSKLDALFNGSGVVSTVKFYLSPTGERIPLQLESRCIEEYDGSRTKAISWVHEVPKTVKELLELQSQIEYLARELAHLKQPCNNVTHIHGGTNQNAIGGGGNTFK